VIRHIFIASVSVFALAASLLSNGHALIEGNSGTLYEFDGTSLTAEPVNVGGTAPLLLLPSGNVLVAGFETYAAMEPIRRAGSRLSRIALPP